MNNSVKKGTMKVGLKNENGFTLTKEYGFTVQEENGSVLAFDLFDHPELGTMLLFGNQVFALGYWSEDQLTQALNMVSNAIGKEKIKKGISHAGCFS